MAHKGHFSADLFDFLSELADNNNREWFQANKDRYRRTVQEPLLRFISDFSGPLGEISPFFVADPRPAGGSMFRIYRDVRFSRNKSPYKTHAAAQFRHQEGKDAHVPCFYLHLEPGSVFAGAGLWHPPGPALTSIRNAIVESPETWTSMTTAKTFSKTFTIGGDSLKRAPRGIDPDHPLIDDLKRKDFICSRNFTQKQATSANFHRPLHPDLPGRRPLRPLSHRGGGPGLRLILRARPRNLRLDYSALRDGNRMAVPEDHLPKDYQTPAIRVHPLEQLLPDKPRQLAVGSLRCRSRWLLQRDSSRSACAHSRSRFATTTWSLGCSRRVGSEGMRPGTCGLRLRLAACGPSPLPRPGTVFRLPNSEFRLPLL